MKRRVTTPVVFHVLGFRPGAPAQDVDVSASVANPDLRSYHKTIAGNQCIEIHAATTPPKPLP